MPSKEIDRWLKAEIEKVPEKLVRFRDKKLESKMVYYTGNWHKDVIANLTQTEYDKPEVITGYQYIVMRERGTNA